MDSLTSLLAFLLSSLGLTVVIVWPQDGPSAWFRERLLRPRLSSAVVGVLDCYICCGFWVGLLLAPIWWIFAHEPWLWSGCLMTPGVFWLILRPSD